MRNKISKKLVFGASVLLVSFNALSFTSSPAPNPLPEPTPSCEVDCDFTRGPAPTSSSLEAAYGPYSVATKSVSSS